MFNRNGAFVMVDGQFGSTGKGVLAGMLAYHRTADYVDLCVSNAGPNSGHTFYDHADTKIVLKQLPTFAVARKRQGKEVVTYLSAGAIINPEILNREVAEHDVQVMLSASAAVISPADIEMEGSGTVAAVAGTRQGVGAAQARKILRDPTAIVAGRKDINWHPNISVVDGDWQPNARTQRMFFEVSQGFSLGLNSGFYPKVTSRECTVAQALADARVSPGYFARSSMVIRTFPIRVGNFEGHSSGDCYKDQEEISWESIGIEPELTTVTKRPRRLFTFSWIQYTRALMANSPHLIFINFMNYIPEKKDRVAFAGKLRTQARIVLGREPDFLYGYGPKMHDVSRRVK